MKAFLRSTAETLLDRLGIEISRKDPLSQYANPDRLDKATNFAERFREVVSDPLNLLIRRVPDAGFIREGKFVILHNGNRVPVTGKYAYYGNFSKLLIINRGVHEPLEEFCFQQMLSKIVNPAPVCLELGAYWAHYSMWLKKALPQARCIMVEPDPSSLASGKHNFALNGYEGEFINAMVSASGFAVDAFMAERGLVHLDILHSDIQGYETEMLKGAEKLLAGKQADYVFISTHGDSIHAEVTAVLGRHGYRIEVSSDYNTHTTSADGFVLATSPDIAPLFDGFKPLGRLEIAKASPEQLLESLRNAH